MDQKRPSNIPYLAAILLVSVLLSARSLSADGYMSVLTEDTYAFTSWAWQFTESLKNGIIYPRWMSLDFWGYGSPTFILYPPLSYYATALFEPFCSSVLQAMNFLKFLSVFATGIGIYVLTKKRFESLIALSTAILFICSPFYVFFVHYYGTFAAICSIPFLPIILKKIFDFYQSENEIDIAIAGIIYGLLLMTHLITAYMFAFVIFTLFLTKYNRIKPLEMSLNLGIFTCISFLTASPYILPLLFEIGNLRIENFIDHRSGFAYNEFFIFPIKYSLTSHFWNKYNFFFKSIFITYSLLLIILTFAKFYFKYVETNIDKRFNMAFTIAAIFTILVQTSWSQFIWIFIPFFKFIQFPFRWTIITCLLVTLLAADFLKYLKDTLKNGFFFKFLLGLIFISLIYMDFVLISYSHTFKESSLFSQVNSAYWTKEHLPKGVDIYNIKSENTSIEFLTPLRGDFIYKTIDFEAQKKKFLIDSLGSSVVRIRHFYFPGWKAYLNGKEVLIEKERLTNAMFVRIPEGRNTLEIIFEDTPIRKFSKYIFVSFILSLSVFFFWHVKKLRIPS